LVIDVVALLTNAPGGTGQCSEKNNHLYLSPMWRWLARITTGVSLGLFAAIMLFLIAIVVIGVLAFLWIILWTDV
jgi:hypothetical protein